MTRKNRNGNYISSKNGEDNYYKEVHYHLLTANSKYESFQVLSSKKFQNALRANCPSNKSFEQVLNKLSKDSTRSTFDKNEKKIWRKWKASIGTSKRNVGTKLIMTLEVPEYETKTIKEKKEDQREKKRVKKEMAKKQEIEREFFGLETLG